MNKPRILIISDTFDFASDYICYELKRRQASYYRLNRDRIFNYEVEIDVENNELYINCGTEKYLVSPKTLKSIYYRAPIFLRDIYQPDLSPSRQLFRTQWSSFYRNLVIFENVKWINNPQATFNAESKIFQLKKAKEAGFFIPITKITNTKKSFLPEKKYIIKSIDTAILKVGESEAFVYSNVVDSDEISQSNINNIPIILQNYLSPKIDLRVTIVGGKIFSVQILKNREGVEGDWRLKKDKVEYIPIELPIYVKNSCLMLMKKLNLKFGAIDLIYCDNKYYFIEINPTGEWAWLIDSAGLPLDKAICDELQSL